MARKLFECLILAGLFALASLSAQMPTAASSEPGAVLQNPFFFGSPFQWTFPAPLPSAALAAVAPLMFRSPVSAGCPAGSFSDGVVPDLVPLKKESFSARHTAYSGRVFSGASPACRTLNKDEGWQEDNHIVYGEDGRVRQYWFSRHTVRLPKR